MVHFVRASITIQLRTLRPRLLGATLEQLPAEATHELSFAKHHKAGVVAAALGGRHGRLPDREAEQKGTHNFLGICSCNSF